MSKRCCKCVRSPCPRHDVISAKITNPFSWVLWDWVAKMAVAESSNKGTLTMSQIQMWCTRYACQTLTLFPAMTRFCASTKLFTRSNQSMRPPATNLKLFTIIFRHDVWLRIRWLKLRVVTSIARFGRNEKEKKNNNGRRRRAWPPDEHE